jgi:plastocyanin
MRKFLVLVCGAALLAVAGVAAAKTVTVTIAANGYVPNATAIAVGDTVQFTNSDKVAHQVSFKKTTGVSCTPTPLVLQPAQSGSCIFRSVGTFSYSDPNVKGNKFHGTITVTGSVAGGGSLTLTVKPQIVVYGGKATLSGALSNHKAGENAEILAQPCGQPSATKVATVTTTSGGVYSAQVQPLKNTIYTVKVKNSTSNAVSVKVRPRLRLGKVAPHRYSLRVFAAQSFAGKSASFQRYSAALRRWLVVRRVVLRANTSGIAPTVISSVTFRSSVRARLRVRAVLGQTQVGSCYIAGRSNIIHS